MMPKFFQSARTAVLSCSAGKACGILLARRSGAWLAERAICRTEPHSSGCGAMLKALLKDLGCSGNENIYLAGELPGSYFFRYSSIPLPYREQISAIELALPERLPVPMEDPRIQFSENYSGEKSELSLQICAVPGDELEKFCSDLKENALKADEFLNPLLLLHDDDPPFFMDDLHPGFCFHHGVWRTAPDKEEKEKALAQWQNTAGKLMTLPENFDIGNFLPLIPVIRMETAPESAGSRASLRLLPENLRPLRYRHQLELTGILLFLLILCLMWGNIREWSAQYRAYTEIMEQCQTDRARISEISGKLKRHAKIEREMNRIAGLQAGEERFLEKLAALSRVLPDNVQLVNLRMNENSWDLMLQSESSSLNLPALINPLGYWKIAQLQQRQMWNSDVTTVNLRLVPPDIPEKGKANRSYKTGSHAR